MCFHDTVTMGLPLPLRHAGLALFIAGVGLFVLSYVRIGGFKENGHLVTGGIYSKIRNPMYLGFMIWILGFPLFLDRVRATISSVSWIAHLMVWKTMEEKELLAKYPEYQAYTEKTSF